MSRIVIDRCGKFLNFRQILELSDFDQDLIILNRVAMAGGNLLKHALQPITIPMRLILIK